MSKVELPDEILDMVSGGRLLVGDHYQVASIDDVTLDDGQPGYSISLTDKRSGEVFEWAHFRPEDLTAVKDGKKLSGAEAVAVHREIAASAFKHGRLL